MATRTFTYKINMDLAGVKTGSKTMQVTLASMQGDAAKTDASMQKLADTIGKRYGVQTSVARDETKSFQNAIKQAARDANRAEKSYEQITKEFKQLQASIGMSTDKLQVFNAQQRLGANATEQQKKQIADLVIGYQEMRDAANQTQGSMRGLRGQAQNVGWQLQDISVQAQMGTDALTILGQQGSQFASGFGPMGALIGAGIAVVAASIGVLVPSLMKTEKPLEELAKTMTKLRENLTKNSDGVYEFSDALLELGKVSKAVVEAEIAASMIRADIAVTNASKSIVKATNNLKIGRGLSEISDYIEAINKNRLQFNDGWIKTSTDLGEAFGKTGTEAFNLGQSLIKNIAAVNKVPTAKGLEDLQIKLSKLALGGKGVSQEAKLMVSDMQEFFMEAKSAADMTAYLTKRLEAFNKGQSLSVEKSEEWLDSLRQQVDVLGYNATQVLNYERGLKLAEGAAEGATLAQMTLVNAYYDALVTASELSEETEQYTQFLKELTKAEEDNVKAVEKQADAYDVFLQKLNDAEAQLEKNRENLLAKRSDSGKIAQLKKQYEEEMKLAQGNAEAMGNIEEYYARERIKVNGDVWEKLAVQSMEALEDTDEMMLQSMDRLVSGFGTAMAQMVTGSKKPGEALKDMFAGAIGSMVQFFAEWAAQKLILWALDKTLNAGTAASHATAMGANTGAKVAEAGLNAYAATAAIPIVGPALAPAAAGMAIAATSPMAATATTLASIGIGAFDRGGLIPAGGAGIVSEIGDELVGGTMVYNGSQNSLGVTGREDTARMRGGNGPVSITVNSSGNASPEAISRALVRALKRKSKGLDTGLYDAMNRGRTNRGKRFNA